MPTVTIRPNGAGTYTEFLGQYPASTTHWSKVDEVTPNDSTDFVSVGNTTSMKRDSYALEDVSLPAGSTIVKIRFNIRARIATPGNFYGDLWFFLRTNSADYVGNILGEIDVWATEYQEFATNPVTGLAWTEAEINALEAGARGYNVYEEPYGWGAQSVTWLEIVVTYTTPTVAGGILAQVI